MSVMLRALVIGIAVGLGLTVLLVGGAGALGVPERWFRWLFLASAFVGCLAAYYFFFQAEDRQR